MIRVSVKVNVSFNHLSSSLNSIMKHFTALLLTLALAMGTHADCGKGMFQEKLQYNWDRTSICDRHMTKSGRVWWCGDSGTTLGKCLSYDISVWIERIATDDSAVEKQSQITLRAGKVDSTVYVICDGWGQLYHCSANQMMKFRNYSCKGSIASVENVREKNCYVEEC